MSSLPERSPAPPVSVLVAAYDVEPYLERCLDSLVGQTLSDIEVVVVDDASTDRTAEIAARFAERDARVRLIRHEENRGAGGARNTALDAATGEWIAFVDGDDWMVDHALERIHARCVSAGSLSKSRAYASQPATPSGSIRSSARRASTSRR